MSDNNCIFCKIVAGQAPSYQVYEDANFLAFLDIRPLNLGHTLVIPKKHYRWVWDYPDLGEYFQVVGKVVKAMKKALNTDYIVSLVLGEEVPHAHVWLIPRFEDDGHGGAVDLKNIKQIDQVNMERVAAQIKRQIGVD